MFTTNGKSVSVNGVVQESGVTVNDFTSVVLYTVTAMDGSTKIYNVSVKDDPFQMALGDAGQAGGLVFYINPNYASDGWKYIEAAPTQQNRLRIEMLKPAEPARQ